MGKTQKNYFNQGDGKMKKSDWQYLVDTLLFLCMIGIIFVGFLMGLVLPKGPAVEESAKYFLSLHRHQWGNIHFYLSIAFTVLLIIHLVLSWKWIKGKAKQIFKKGWSAALILTSVVSVLIPVLFWILYPKIPGAYDQYGMGAGKRAKEQRFLEEAYSIHEETIFYEDGTVGFIITGQTTLHQVEKATGVPAENIIKALGFPKSVSLDEGFGQLRKKYPITLPQVREIISELLNKPPEPSEEKEIVEEAKEKKLIKEEERPKQAGEEEHEPKMTRGRLAEDQTVVMITGRMTLLDIQKETGISARNIADFLRLPETAPLDETLGRLTKRYPITMQDVRNVIASSMEKK